ncbi:MAG: P-type transfer ATPase VirB11, partial [Rhizorhabdus sp.]|nr:P-type transfer ATPase VirB11 [Rhizorhabdus sp.]
MIAPDRSIYLDGYLSLLTPFLVRPDVSDIYINRPGELWLEANGREPERHLVPELTRDMLLRLARQIAASSAQGISREHPILAAALPTGERVQIVVPPATRGEVAISIRRQVISSLDLHALKPREAATGRSPANMGTGEAAGQRGIAEILQEAVRDRKTILISGGTSSGKTTLLNALLAEISP